MTDGERMLTASEVKVLTETASKVAYALGRKDAAEEFDQLGATLMEFANNDRTRMRQATDLAMRAVYKNRADGYGDSAEAILRVSRNLSSQPSQASPDATSGVPGHPEVSEAVRSPQEPYECSCYKLPRATDGILRHHPDCPNATEGSTP